MAGAQAAYGLTARDGGGALADGLILLLICVALGIAGRNPLIAGAAAVLLLLRLGRVEVAIRFLDQRGTSLGILLLVAGLLAPLAGDRLTMRAFAGELLRPSGWIGLGVAAVAAWFGRNGVDFLHNYPAALVGMIVGSVLGTIFLRGVPTGPLIAAGLTATLLQAMRLR